MVAEHIIIYNAYSVYPYIALLGMQIKLLKNSCAC